LSVANSAATTELNAVNILLATIGESPINTLVGEDLHVDAAMAKNTLDAVRKELQCTPWYFNTEEKFPLVPNEEGYIILPPTVHTVDVMSARAKYRDIDVVVRGNKLYDRKNHTYKFDRMIEADVVLILPFNELPQTAKNYLVIRAARKFQTQAVGSEALYNYTARDEAMARAEFMANEVRQADRNMLEPTSNSAMGYRSVFNVMRRW
jgi:hypothetical protein